MKNKKVVILFSLILIFIVLTASLFFLGNNQKNEIVTKVNEETENYIVSKMGACGEASEKSKCLKETANDFLNNFTLAQVMEVFRINEQTSHLLTSCHEASHFLGQAGYKKHGSIPDVFPQCNNSCLGGCFHGVVEGYFIKKNISLNEPDEKIAAEVAKICGKEEDYQRPQAFTECFHGLGHALMFLTENDLLKSLKFCDAIDKLHHREYCYTGSFMANSDGGGSIDHPSKYYKADEPMYVCTIVEDRYIRMCYTYAVTQAFQADVATTIKLCGEMPKEYREECYKTFGRDRVNGPTTDVSIMKGQCDQITTSEYRFSCYLGLSWSLMIRYGPTSTYASDFCYLVDDKYKKGCYEQVFNGSKQWTREKDELKQSCKNVREKTYEDQCLAGI